jgi:lipopolysaccharide/colanic/teichoic acid biosynthesis glycosyltransferase
MVKNHFWSDDMALVAKLSNLSAHFSNNYHHFCLGDILLASGLVTNDQLQCALTHQVHAALEGKWVLLGEVLVSWGVISEAELETSIQKLSQHNELRRFEAVKHPAVISGIKRLIDIAGALVGLSLTALVLPWVAIAIYCEDQGPIFFKQPRVGLNGWQFTIWKFRSMIPNADQLKLSIKSESELFFSPKEDPRITRVGRILRKTMIDEFPQFWNVLMGNMSLVGTRPPTLDEVRHYQHHHWKRLKVKPGMTGLWQVSKNRHAKDFEAVLALDLEYQRRWNIRLDLSILFKTIYGGLIRTQSI